MLRRVVVTGVLVVLVPAGSFAVVVAPASAQASLTCVERDGDGSCLLELDLSASGDPPVLTATVSGNGGGTMIWCGRGPNYEPEIGAFATGHLEEVKCWHGSYGWYSQAYDCHFMADPDIPPDSERVIGYEPSVDGSVYKAMCYTANHDAIPEANYCFNCTPPNWYNFQPHYVFLAAAPDGFGGTPDPVPDLLVQVIDELTLMGPTIGTAPPAGQGSALVRLPVWLWNEVSDNNWGTVEEDVSGSGITLLAEATAEEIIWDMGDGETEPCAEGMTYEPGMDVFQPPCGHTYQQASRGLPGGTYPIEATTTWHLEWWTVGLPVERGGEFDVYLTSTTELQVSELQVLNRHPE